MDCRGECIGGFMMWGMGEGFGIYYLLCNWGKKNEIVGGEQHYCDRGKIIDWGWWGILQRGKN